MVLPHGDRPATRFRAGGTCHTIWDVDPVAKTAAVWLNNLPAPQQMTVSEDGQMLFVIQATHPGDVLGIDVVTKAPRLGEAPLGHANARLRLTPAAAPGSAPAAPPGRSGRRGGSPRRRS